jgi:hypothetical protein
MIEKFAILGGEARSEFLDLNHASKLRFLVSLQISKLAPDLASSLGELRNRDTSERVEKSRKMGRGSALSRWAGRHFDQGHASEAARLPA